jgi:uncharacterized protein YjbI with pentapeptide repeats
MSTQRRTEARQPARLPSRLEPVAGGVLADDTSVDGAEISGDLTGDVEDVELRASRWRGGRLTGACLQRLRCVDVVFEDCDLSGAIV